MRYFCYKLSKIVLSVLGIVCFMYYSAKTVGRNKDKKIRVLQNIECLLDMIEKEKRFTEILSIKKGSRVTVYGNGSLGRHVVRELIKESVQVVGIIDRASFISVFEDIPIYDLECNLPSTDMVLVTVDNDFKNIKRKLTGILDCPIVNVVDVMRKC